MADSIGLGIAMAMIGIGALGIVISGIRAVLNGKSDFRRLAITTFPILVFIVTFLVVGDAAQAGITTLAVMLFLMVFSIFISGTRGTFRA